MKILSYNINGLMAFCNSGKMSSLFEDYPADIYCFQEVKCGVEKTINKLFADVTDEYNIYNSINTYKKGYAGVTTLVNKNIPIVNVDIPEPFFDEYTAGRVINIEFEKYHLINIYTLNSGKKAMQRLVFDSELDEYLKKLKKPFIIIGDLNVCHESLDYWDVWEKSINKGPGLMDFEINGINTLIKNHNLVDSFRLLHPTDKTYSYFCGSYGAAKAQKAMDANHGWRLDYALVTDSIKENIVEASIESCYNGADHSPILLNLKD